VATIAERVPMSCRAVDAVEILTNDPAQWIAPFFKIASFEGMRAGNELRLSLGMDRAASDDNLVLIDFDEPEQVLGGAVVIPFRWRAVGIPALFTTFAGRFVIWSAGESETILAVEGVTDGQRSADEAIATITNHAASAALRSLVRNLRTAIEEASRSERNIS
jgi:hypothetical protein